MTEDRERTQQEGRCKNEAHNPVKHKTGIKIISGRMSWLQPTGSCRQNMA